MTLTFNPRVRVRVRVRVEKVRKPYQNFQMVPLSMTLSDLWPTFQGHYNIQRPITRIIVSRVWSVHWFRFQWPWVTVNVDFKVTEMPSTNCMLRRRCWLARCTWRTTVCQFARHEIIPSATAWTDTPFVTTQYYGQTVTATAIVPFLLVQCRTFPPPTATTVRRSSV